ncbi:MAG: hypothetical protein ACRESX_06665 [Gammaproteobacteria bacterium]
MQKRHLILGVFVLALIACAKDDDKLLVKARVDVPSITGGFTFKQYVVASPGDNEVLGDEGVLYISPKLFTVDERRLILNSPQGNKYKMFGDEVSAYFHLENACLSSVRESTGKAGDAARYLSLVVTYARTQKDEKSIRLRLYSWPDFWYDWVVKQSGDTYLVVDSSTTQAWGWSSSRIVLIRDPTVTLDTCVRYIRN